MLLTRALLLAFVLGFIVPTGHTRPALPAAGSPPNIIFVLTDDLDVETLAHLPRLRALLTDRGATFSNFFVSLSLCCPSRTTTLRGQYAHNTQVFTNDLPGGGFLKVYQDNLEASTVATWLQKAGYRTVLLGKYLNGYPRQNDSAYIPPGWDEWYSPSGGSPYSEYNYRLNENGFTVTYGHAPSDYLIDVMARKAADYIWRTRPGGRDAHPFFMYVSPYAPHEPATPAPRYEQAFSGVSAPRTPSFNEANVSDKPAWVQSRPLLTASQIAEIDALYRKRLQSMLAVEDLLGTLVRALEDTGQIGNTYIFFSSDNGFHLGQHRLAQGKNTEFEEDLLVPLIVRGPGVEAGRTIEAMAANIDLAPTFADLTGATPPAFVDGRSLLPLLTARATPDAWRHAILLEHGYPGPAALVHVAPGDLTFPGLLEPPDAFEVGENAAEPRPVPMPVFQGLRTDRYIYIEYATGEREVYDIINDPHQLQALKPKPAFVNAMSAWLGALRTCAGEQCRALENRSPADVLPRPRP